MQDLKQLSEKVLQHLKQEIGSLRTGRATPALVEEILVDYYGAKTPLKAVASISAPDARQLLIQPWDKTALPAIEQAIANSSLGLAPISDRDAIRLSLPPLTQERRGELVKLLHRHAEDARIRVRQAREEAIRDVDRRQKAGEISQDDRFRQKNEVQKIIDDSNQKIADLSGAKEKEILTV